MSTLSVEEELKMSKSRRKVDLREEYVRLKSREGDLENWENKRVERLPGQAEWGELPPSLNK